MSLDYFDGFGLNGFPKSCVLKAKTGRQRKHEGHRMPLTYKLDGLEQDRHVLRQLAVPAAGEERDYSCGFRDTQLRTELGAGELGLRQAR